MSKPARLNSKPEPIVINPRFVYLGCGAMAILFFIVGWTFQNIGVFA